MVLLTVLVFCVGFTTVYSSNCDDVSGSWQNELGSRMILNVDNSNRISGEYHTAVETRPGAAGHVSNITGLLSKQSDGALLAFSVLFNHGFSLATWVGQCMVCDGKEVLHTTYTLRMYTADYQGKWAAVITNQNTFWRSEDKSENAIQSMMTSFPATRSPSLRAESGGLELNGKWKSPDNEEIEFFGGNSVILEGRTTCCHLTGKHHTTDLVGRKDGNKMFTAVSFMSASSKRIRSWTGHVYEISSTDSKTLETTWLEHEFNPSCTNGRNSVKFGKQDFTRISPKFENVVEQPETFLEKIRKFFTSIF